jgi:ribonuclease HI
MPPQIVTALNKIINDFLWDDGHGPRIALEYLQLPKKQGGLNILDLQTRNEAIDLMWLKTYLNFALNRQPWAAVSDLIIDAAAPTDYIKEARINPFTQCWNAPTKGPHADKLNDGIRRMLDAARAHNTNLAAVKVPIHVRHELPAWYHIDGRQPRIRSRAAKCLVERHGISTAIDLVNASARVRQQQTPPTHRPSLYCPCNDCVQDRAKGCYNPHECASDALTRLQKIPPKWNPMGPENPPDLLSLTPSRKANNLQAKSNNEHTTFDPSLTCSEHLADGFRVFTTPSTIPSSPALRRPPLGRIPTGCVITLYTDGACLHNGKRNAMCGGGVWAGPENPLNQAIRVPGPAQSNQIGELAATIVAIAPVPLSQPLEIVSDSKYAIEGLTTHLQSWEDKGWIGIKNAAFFKRAAYLLRRCTAPTFFKGVKGHEGIERNEQSDRLAKEGAPNPTPHDLDLSVPNNFNVQGAKLSSLTQAIAYHGIRERMPVPPRPSSSRNIQRAREAIERYNGTIESEASIWASIRRKHFRPKIRQFLFKTIHGVFKIGDYWSHIQAIADRGICTTCGITETMEHTLIQCRSRPMQLIWNLAKETWPHRRTPWPKIDLGTVLGCGALTIPNPVNQEMQQGHGTHHRGASRLLQILISESAFLIRALRCERVIQRKDHNDQEIRAKWFGVINTRLTDDRIIATNIIRNKGFTNLVVNTWEQVLTKEGDIPNNWLNSREVLVGSRASSSRRMP